MGFVEDSDDASPTTYRPMAGEFLDFQAVDGQGNIVLGDVVRRGFRGVVVEDIRS